MADGALHVLRDLATDRAARTSIGLRSLLVVAPSIASDSSASVCRSVFGDPSVRYAVVTNGDRPVGLLTPECAMTGELLRPVMANLDTDPGELAQRLATRLNSDTVHPVIVTDDAGRYVGIVPVTRLLAGLGQPVR